MNDREFLEWCAARFVRLGESPMVDFVGKLCSIASVIPEDQNTPNMGPTIGQEIMLYTVARNR